MAWDNLSEATGKRLRDQARCYLVERFGVIPSSAFIEGTIQVLERKVVGVLRVSIKKIIDPTPPQNLTEFGLLAYRDQLAHHLADIETELGRVQREVADGILFSFGIDTELANTVISEGGVRGIRNPNNKRSRSYDRLRYNLFIDTPRGHRLL